MPKELNITDKIKYLNASGVWKTGVIHAIRKAEDSNGTEHIISYVIDTGKENREHEGRADRQPEQVDVRPDDIKPL